MTDFPIDRRSFLIAGCSALAWPAVARRPDPEPPAEWVEPATGHRVVRLSRDPGTSSLYFHQNPYTATGDKMVVSSPQGLATIALATRTIAPLVEGRVSSLVVGRKTRTAFYMKSGAVYATNVDTGMLSLGHGVFFGLGAYALAMHMKLEAAKDGLPDFMGWSGLRELPGFWAPFESGAFSLTVFR